MSRKSTQLELSNDNAREIIACIEKINKLTTALCAANAEIAFLRAKLAERDHLARRLIKRVNRTTSPRRAAMEEAKLEAQRTGTVVKAQHV